MDGITHEWILSETTITINPLIIRALPFSFQIDVFFNSYLFPSSQICSHWSRITRQLCLNNLLDQNHFLTHVLPTTSGWLGAGSAMCVTAEQGKAGSPRFSIAISSSSSSRPSYVSPLQIDCYCPSRDTDAGLAGRGWEMG